MNTKDFKSNTNTVYTLRINTQLFECIREVAQKNKRSIAKEIEYSLEKLYLQ